MLKLAALDAEDLAVISAHMQDAVVLVGDLSFNSRRKQFASVTNRYAWDEGNQRQRRRTGLHFDRVLSVKTRKLLMTEKDAVLSLLAIGFREGDAPAGEIELTFSGGGAILLAVECIEAQLKDLGPAWATGSTPRHEEGLPGS